MKNFIIGFLCCAILFTVTPIKAAIEEFILFKADYKVVINESEYSDPDYPILNYKGTTYAPLRSMLSAAGLNINWNEDLGQAEINNSLTSTEPTPEPNSVPMPSPIVFKKTEDGLDITEYEGIEYVGYPHIRTKLSKMGYYFGYDKNFDKIILKDSNNTVLLDNIPATEVYQRTSITVEYYKNVILPLIK